MATSPLGGRGGPGPAVLGFLACGAVVRRSAFLAAGGFSLRYGIGGEEELLALDLRRQGWQLSYCDEVVACHHPVASAPVAGRAWRDPAPRRRRQARNALWTAWLRRPLGAAAGLTRRTAAGARHAPLRQGLLDAAAEWRWLLTERRPVPPAIEADLRLLARMAGGEP
jgi:GT2 family glycosyltransferase